MRTMLDERLEQISNIDMTLEKKDKEIKDLRDQVEKWRDSSINLRVDNEHKTQQFEIATKQIEVLKADLVKQDNAVVKLYKSIAEKEEQLLTETQRNAELQEKYKEKDDQLVYLSNTTFVALEKEIERLNLEVLRCKNDVNLKD